MSKFYFSSAELVKLFNYTTVKLSQTCDDIYDHGYRSSRVYEIFIGGKFMKVFCQLEQKGNNWLVSIYVTAYSGLKNVVICFGNFYLWMLIVHNCIIIKVLFQSSLTAFNDEVSFSLHFWFFFDFPSTKMCFVFLTVIIVTAYFFSSTAFIAFISFWLFPSNKQ